MHPLLPLFFAEVCDQKLVVSIVWTGRKRHTCAIRSDLNVTENFHSIFFVLFVMISSMSRNFICNKYTQGARLCWFVGDSFLYFSSKSRTSCERNSICDIGFFEWTFLYNFWAFTMSPENSPHHWITHLKTFSYWITTTRCIFWLIDFYFLFLYRS